MRLVLMPGIRALSRTQALGACCGGLRLVFKPDAEVAMVPAL